MTFAKCMYKLQKNIVNFFWHVNMAPIWCYISWCIVKCIDDILFRSLCIFFYCKIEHFYMSIWINIFSEVKILNSYPIWPNKMTIFAIKICVVSTYGTWYPPLGFVVFTLLYLPTSIELINGRFAILFTWIVIIGLVNTIWSVPTTLIIVVGSVKLQLKFLLVETPFDPLLDFFQIQLIFPFWQHPC